jgi:hypothetical protein
VIWRTKSGKWRVEYLGVVAYFTRKYEAKLCLNAMIEIAKLKV